jgi:hypothetical protein
VFILSEYGRPPSWIVYQANSKSSQHSQNLDATHPLRDGSNGESAFSVSSLFSQPDFFSFTVVSKPGEPKALGAIEAIFN